MRKRNNISKYLVEAKRPNGIKNSRLKQTWHQLDKKIKYEVIFTENTGKQANP